MNNPTLSLKWAAVGRWAFCSIIALSSLPDSMDAQVKPPVSAASSEQRGQQDINPALIYWQAYSVLPELKEDENHRVSDRQAVEVNKETKDLAARFDQSFKMLRRATESRAACDWGVDLSQGPEAMLPQLAKAKRLAQAATFRGQIFLAQGQEAKAIAEWVDAYVLGRRLSTDTILISALVQFAIENIITSAIAENYYRLSPEALQTLGTRLAAAPARGDIARCVATEKSAFVDWYVGKIEAIRLRHGTDEAGALEEATALLNSTLNGEEDVNVVPEVIAAAGRTTKGLIDYLQQAGQPYTQLAAICALPYEEYQKQINAFAAAIEKEGNILVKLLVPAVMKSRSKEFGIIARNAMMQAAIAYRVNGADGLGRVADPFGQGPFGFRRVLAGGVDRGFELKSELNYRGFPEVLVLIESAGPALRIDGANAGEPIPAAK